MKNFTFAALMLLSIWACNENPYEAVAAGEQLAPDRETIAKLITGFDHTIQFTLSSNSDFSDSQMGALYVFSGVYRFRLPNGNCPCI